MLATLKSNSFIKTETGTQHSELQVVSLARGWNFRCFGPAPGPESLGPWAVVDLPHTPFVADLDGREHWFGVCEYERIVQLPSSAPTGRVALYLGAAMHTAVVFVDGLEVGRHEGGYLPFEIDLTAALSDGQGHALTVRLDNRDNADVPPGKPYADLDFCWYGGLYRDAELRCYPALHITDAVGSGETGGGGILVRTLAAHTAGAAVNVRAHVRNATGAAADFRVEVELLHEGAVVARSRSATQVLPGDSAAPIELELRVAKPRLWSVDSPVLHTARVTLRGPGGEVLDVRSVRFGIRRISFSRSGGFVLNGRRLRLRGTNRHQEYPRAGYAAPAAAQRRDARLLKEAGFDYVRCSHYPPAPEFLDACDELGLVVMDAIPGWQFIGGERFREACHQNARDVIRRDRNHPCVVLWELSLNETQMDEDFMARLHAIGHEELPGDQMFTCGWMDRYDVFIHSRQHGAMHRWKNGDKALVVAEYGDWEFYAANEGFDQKTGAGVLPREGNSRKRRADGERGLRRQLENHVIALNDTLSSPAVFDGQWAMFDYARGYDPQRAACGVADIFRLPKFSYWFYRSQRAAHEDGGAAWSGGPVVLIASHWTPASARRVLVLGNCEEVELRLNGASLGRQLPARNTHTQHLPHPPFAFEVPAFAPGALEATGFIGGRVVATHRVATPGAPAKLEIEIATAGVNAGAGEPDVLLAHARLLDAAGTLCVSETAPVQFSLIGGAELLGPAAPEAEAGIASCVIRVPAGLKAFTLRAEATASGRKGAAQCEWCRSEAPQRVEQTRR